MSRLSDGSAATAGPAEADPAATVSDPTVPVVAAVASGLGSAAGAFALAVGLAGFGLADAAGAAMLLTLAAGMVSKTACVPTGWGNEHQPYSELCWTDLAGTSVDAGAPPHPRQEPRG